MTTDERTLTETANRLLQQARENDRTQHPRTKPPVTLAGALSSATLPPVTHDDLYPSAHQYDAWKTHPERMTNTQHDQYCSAGFVTYATPLGLQTDPCPRCQAEKRNAKLRAQIEASGIGGRYLDTEWSDLQLLAPLDRVARGCERIANVIESGENLLLYSTQTGSGKTQAAMLTAKAAIRAGFTAHVANLARLAVDVRDGYNTKNGEALTEKTALARLTAPDLLVIDDLGAGETDTAAVERRLLFLALDERQMRVRPTVVTTNLDPQGLAKLFGARVIARLQPLTVLHVSHGENFRVKKGRDALW